MVYIYIVSAGVAVLKIPIECKRARAVPVVCPAARRSPPRVIIKGDGAFLSRENVRASLCNIALYRVRARAVANGRRSRGIALACGCVYVPRGLELCISCGDF